MHRCSRSSVHICQGPTAGTPSSCVRATRAHTRRITPGGLSDGRGMHAARAPRARTGTPQTPGVGSRMAARRPQPAAPRPAAPPPAARAAPAAGRPRPGARARASRPRPPPQRAAPAALAPPCRNPGRGARSISRRARGRTLAAGCTSPLLPRCRRRHALCGKDPSQWPETRRTIRASAAAASQVDRQRPGTGQQCQRSLVVAAT